MRKTFNKYYYKKNIAVISRITFKILSSHRLAHHTGNDDYITNNFTNREQRQKRARHARAGTGRLILGARTNKLEVPYLCKNKRSDGLHDASRVTLRV